MSMHTRFFRGEKIALHDTLHFHDGGVWYHGFYVTGPQAGEQVCVIVNEPGVSTMIIQDNLVKDENDQYWVYGGGKIRCVGDDSEDGGYYCSSFEEGIKLLIEYGYMEEQS